MKPVQFLLLSLSIFGLIACGGDSSSGSNEASLTNSAVIDESAQTLTVYSPTCTYSDSNGAVTFDSLGLAEFYNYSVDAGVLTLVDEENDTTEFTGTSLTIIGTWEMSESGVDITIDISETSVNTSLEYADDFCFMDEFAESYGDTYDITKISCTEGSITIAENVVMTVKINEMSANGSYSISFSYNGETCTYTITTTPVTESLCTVENYEAEYIDDDGTDYSISNDEDFGTCMDSWDTGTDTEDTTEDTEVETDSVETAVAKISKSLAKVLSSAKK